MERCCFNMKNKKTVNENVSTLLRRLTKTWNFRDKIKDNHRVVCNNQDVNIQNEFKFKRNGLTFANTSEITVDMEKCKEGIA